MKNPIRIERLGEARSGYRVLASWKRPGREGLAEAWIPELAPGHVLRRRRAAGVLSWKAYLKGYREELRSPSSQDLLKPLSLLSVRRSLVVLCDCAERRRCCHRSLAEALKGCRERKRFALSFKPISAAGRALCRA